MYLQLGAVSPYRLRSGRTSTWRRGSWRRMGRSVPRCGAFRRCTRACRACAGIRPAGGAGPDDPGQRQAGFAKAVADGGGLPFLALSLLRDPINRAARPDPGRARRPAVGRRHARLRAEEIRAAQLEVVREVRPPVALIAGGRPAQAAPWRRTGSPPTSTSPRPVCSTCSSQTAPAGSCSRAGSAAATSGRAPASSCGRRSSSGCSSTTPPDELSRSCSRAGSTTPGRPRWSRALAAPLAARGAKSAC